MLVYIPAPWILWDSAMVPLNDWLPWFFRIKNGEGLRGHLKFLGFSPRLNPDYLHVIHQIKAPVGMVLKKIVPKKFQVFDGGIVYIFRRIQILHWFFCISHGIPIDFVCFEIHHFLVVYPINQKNLYPFNPQITLENNSSFPSEKTCRIALK